MTLFLLRHAQAGSRGRFDGEDLVRPLSSEGRHQAADIVGALRELGITGVLSSPYRRCIETAAPTAAALGLRVAIEDCLAEGPSAHAIDLARKFALSDVVFCSHGDVIPAILEWVQVHDAVDLGREPRCQKGSVWMLEPDRDTPGRFVSASYLPPPRIRFP